MDLLFMDSCFFLKGIESSGIDEEDDDDQSENPVNISGQDFDFNDYDAIQELASFIFSKTAKPKKQSSNFKQSSNLGYVYALINPSLEGK